MEGFLKNFSKAAKKAGVCPALPECAYLGAGIVPCEDVLKGAPVFCHGVGAVLAHAHPVAVAGHVKYELSPVPGDGEGGRPQGEQGSYLSSGEGDASQGDGDYTAAIVAAGLPKPCGGVPGQIRAGVGGQGKGLDLFRAQLHLGAVVGNLVPLGTVHALQVGHRVAPDLRRVHGLPGGGGEKQRLDGLAVVKNAQAVCFRHRPVDLLSVLPGIQPPAGLRRRALNICLTAGAVAADVGAGMLAAVLPDDGVGPGGADLGLQGLLLKGGGHFRRRHAPEIVCHRQLCHIALLGQQAHRAPSVPRPGRGGGGALFKGRRALAAGQIVRVFPLVNRLPPDNQRRQEKQHNGKQQRRAYNPACPAAGFYIHHTYRPLCHQFMGQAVGI